MGGHLVRTVCVLAVAFTLILQGCDKPSLHTATLHESSPSVAAPSKYIASHASAPKAPAVERNALTVDATAPQQQLEATPPWLAELLGSADPAVRLQGLEAWAHEPTAALNPITFALVDPDERVRARAQQLFEQELGRR